MDDNLKQFIINHFSPNPVNFVDRDGNSRIIVKMENGKHDIELSTTNHKVGIPIVDNLNQAIYDYLQSL